MHENQVNVEEKPHRRGGFPHIETEGCIIPLQLKHGLLTLPTGSPTDHELHTCDMVQMTSEDPWDPSMIHDEEISRDTCL
jgi:hypothetical protein